MTVRKAYWGIFLFGLMGFSSLKAVSPIYGGDSSAKGFLVKPNAIKFSLFEFINGDIPLYFERRFSRKLSVQIGLGITGKDPIWELSRNFTNLDARSFVESKIGFSIKAGARIYFSDRDPALKGPYFEARFQFRYYHGFVSECNSPTSISIEMPYLKETRAVGDLLTLIGKQIYTRQNFVMDFYFGGGMRMREGFSVRCRFIDGIGNVPARVHEQRNSPKFAMGINIGFGL